MRSPGIQIIRDVDGIAHVRAQTLTGAFRGQGYAAAEDRLWQLELDRRRSLGRLAEVVGPSAVTSDTFHRRMDLAGQARRSFDALDDETRTVLSAYAEGINDHLSGDPRLPVEFELLDLRPEPWEPWQSIALYHLRHLAMGSFETKVWRSGLVRNLGPERAWRLWRPAPEIPVDPDAELVRDPADVAAELVAGAAALAHLGHEQASNNLAISAARTVTGRPILAGDPHRAIDLPNVYWQNHLTCDEGLDVIGLSFPGVPGFPHFGHNPHVAWCITHGMADDQDVYVVDMHDDGDQVRYRHGGAWREAAVRTETVDVAGADAVTVRCVTTHHGPVVASHGDHGLALRWTAHADVDTTFDALVPMLRAASVGDLDRAMEPWVVPVNNLVMADTAGAIAYRMRGRLAKRGTDNGWTAVAGDDPARDWEGFVPDTDLPRWRDPDRGFLVTANNRVSAGGPYVGHDYAHPARATRLVARLAGSDAWDVGSVAAMLGDTHSEVAAAFARRVLAVDAATRTERAAQALLATWDHHCDGGSAAAALYGAVRAELVVLVSHDLDLVDDRIPGVDGPTLHQTMRFVNARLATWITDVELVTDRAVAAALRSAVRTLEQEQGSDPKRWRWDVAHTAMWVHPLAVLRPDLAARLPTPPTVGLGGDTECLWATSTAPPSRRASNGQVARYVFDVGDWDRSVWVVPHGVSGDPRSAHHLDQLADWASMTTRPMRYSAATVDAATESVVRIG